MTAQVRLNPGDSWDCACGAEHTVNAFVGADWEAEQVHTCYRCGRQHTLKAGVLMAVKSEGQHE